MFRAHQRQVPGCQVFDLEYLRCSADCQPDSLQVALNVKRLCYRLAQLVAAYPSSVCMSPMGWTLTPESTRTPESPKHG
jgi:hypothetical protein